MDETSYLRYVRLAGDGAAAPTAASTCRSGSS